MSDLAIKPTVLLAAGYRQYAQHDMNRYKGHLYQRRILDAEGATLYFIYFTEWTFPEFDRMSVEVTLYAEPNVTMNLGLHVEPDMSMEDVEAFYAHAHKALGCGEDRHNQ